MTAHLGESNRLPTSDLGHRLAALETAVSHGRGRLDDEAVDRAETVVHRASGRMRLSADHAVIAIGGATGSGKSSTFNRLTDLDLSAVGVRRPTTSWASACVFGAEGATELLEWLGIPARHQVTRDSMLDTGNEDKSLQGTVLLDLPDHDSTELSHHLEVDRLVDLADVLVWILDPQKYADAALHDRYLKPLAGRDEVVLVVLNHIDTVPEESREAMVADVRRLLDADGLTDAMVLPISAKHEIGTTELKAELAGRVAAKRANRARVEGDLRAAAGRLAEISGTEPTPELTAEQTAELETTVVDAAGVPVILDGFEATVRHRIRRATGWPPALLFAGSRGPSRTPQTARVERARVRDAVRALADGVGNRLTLPWRSTLGGSVQHEEFCDALDDTLRRTELGSPGLPGWAHAARVLQWLLLLAAVGGLVWFVLSLAGAVPAPAMVGVPLPAVLLVGGLLLGVLLAVVCRSLAAKAARTRTRAAEEQVRSGLAEVCRRWALEPIDAELGAYEKVRAALETAAR